MITLKALRVEALKGLREVDLRLPPHGAVLIEGANESGKSTLFEAVYFALYGRALTGEERPTLAGLIPHDQTRAAVELTVALDGGGELRVERILTRGRNGAVTSEAALAIHRPDGQDERVNAVNAVNERIEQELGGIDYDTFRNSLFMEQKGLERIEEMSRENRDKAVSRLLGLERLAKAERAVAPTSALLDRRETLRRQLDVAGRLDLARAAGARGAAAGERLRAAEIRAAIARRDALAHQRDTQLRRQTELTEERDTLHARLEEHDRVAALERALTAAGALRWAAINAERETEVLTVRLRDRASGEQFTVARRRLEEISTLEERVALAQIHLLQARDLAAAAERISRSSGALNTAQREIAQAEASLTAASEDADREASAHERVSQALDGWMRARETANQQSESAQSLANLRADQDRQRAKVISATKFERWWLFAAVAATALSLALVAVALATRQVPWWAIVVAAAVVVGLGVQCVSATTGRRAQVRRVRQLDSEISDLTMQANLSRWAGGADLEHYEEALRAAGLAVPTSLDVARAMLEELPPPDPAIAERIRESEAALARARFSEERATQDLDKARDDWRAHRATAGIQPDQATLRYTDAQRDLEECKERAHALGLPDDLTGLSAARGAALEAVRALETASGDLSLALAQPDSEPRRDVVNARDEWAAALTEITANARAAGLNAPQAPDAGGGAFTLERLESWHAALAAILTTPEGSDETDGLRARSGANAVELEQTAAACERVERDRARLGATISAWLAGVGVEASGDEELAVLAGRWAPLVYAPTLDTTGLEALRAEHAQADREAYHHAQASAEQAEEVGGALPDTVVLKGRPVSLPDTVVLKGRPGSTEAGEPLLADTVVLNGRTGPAEASGPFLADTVVLPGRAGSSGELRVALAGVEREIRQRELAARLASETRARVTRQALPETEAYMRAILPALTLGRYRDVSLTRDDGDTASGAVDLAIRVWDDLAGRYVRKGLFSGGARDQASLALRLAFALATLPRGRGATPGFIFLDEPLSSFDAERSRALARALTHGPIAQAFPQIFLISHSQVIDPRDFDYTLLMEDGRVATSTLPSPEAAVTLWSAAARAADSSSAARSGGVAEIDTVDAGETR